MKKTAPEFDKFDAGMRMVLSVSHDELKAREAEWKRQQAEKKQTRASSPAPVVPAKHS